MNLIIFVRILQELKVGKLNFLNRKHKTIDKIDKLENLIKTNIK